MKIRLGLLKTRDVHHKRVDMIFSIAMYSVDKPANSILADRAKIAIPRLSSINSSVISYVSSEAGEGGEGSIELLES